MTFRDRIRRWWSPARWGEDHPLDRTERAARNRLEHGWTQDLGDRRVNTERDFKKPR